MLNQIQIYFPAQGLAAQGSAAAQGFASLAQGLTAAQGFSFPAQGLAAAQGSFSPAQGSAAAQGFASPAQGLPATTVAVSENVDAVALWVNTAVPPIVRIEAAARVVR